MEMICVGVRLNAHCLIISGIVVGSWTSTTLVFKFWPLDCDVESWFKTNIGASLTNYVIWCGFGGSPWWE